jgi:hypothetical protein
MKEETIEEDKFLELVGGPNPHKKYKAPAVDIGPPGQGPGGEATGDTKAKPATKPEEGLAGA